MMETNKVIKEYYASGALQYEIPFFYFWNHQTDKQDRVQHGVQKCYWPDGQLKEEIPYVEGMIHGEWKGWYPDGSPRWKYLYKRHQRIAKEEYAPCSATKTT